MRLDWREKGLRFGESSSACTARERGLLFERALGGGMTRPDWIRARVAPKCSGLGDRGTVALLLR